jgi:hypothetical protein
VGPVLDRMNQIYMTTELGPNEMYAQPLSWRRPTSGPAALCEGRYASFVNRVPRIVRFTALIVPDTRFPHCPRNH